MDLSLYLSEQHFQVRDMVREFGRTEVAPVARELDRTSTFPWDNIRKMADLGLLGVPWSEEMGGAGMDQLSYYITIHELAKVDASHALTISAHTNLGTSPIMDFGTQAQKEKYVPLLASGKVLGGFGLTEPGAGSDAGGTATTAVDKGDHFVLNGSKIFITHAGVGEIFSVTARTGPGNRVAEQGQDHGVVAEDPARAIRGLGDLDVAGALLAEEALVGCVPEESPAVPVPATVHAVIGEEHLRLRSGWPRHRDLGMCLQQRLQIGGATSLGTDHEQVTRQPDTRSTTWYVSWALTALRVRTTYSPSIESSAMVTPLNTESSTAIVVQPATGVSTKNDRTT